VFFGSLEEALRLGLRETPDFPILRQSQLHQSRYIAIQKLLVDGILKRCT
jgi:hypothetical protein